MFVLGMPVRVFLLMRLGLLVLAVVVAIVGLRVCHVGFPWLADMKRQQFVPAKLSRRRVQSETAADQVHHQSISVGLPLLDSLGCFLHRCF